jgi:hypothetical protein
MIGDAQSVCAIRGDPFPVVNGYGGGLLRGKPVVTTVDTDAYVDSKQ